MRVYAGCCQQPVHQKHTTAGPMPADSKGKTGVAAARVRRSSLRVCGLASIGLVVYVTFTQPFYSRTAGMPGYDALNIAATAPRQPNSHPERCLEIEQLLPPSRPSVIPKGVRPIPLLATNLDFDTEDYLTRLVEGWNTSARHKLLVTGGCDRIMIGEVERLREVHQDLTVYRHPDPLGCAAGWNRILTFMLLNADVEWAMVFNTDIYVPPGALDKLGREIWDEYDRNPRFCRGFFDVSAGQDAVVFVMTRHGLGSLGLFDENIYPAYFEDFDMDLRHNRTSSCAPVSRFSSARMHHGPLQGSEYVSGTSVAREKMRQADPEQQAAGKLLSRRLDIGYRSSVEYLGLKWGCDDEQTVCDFDTPFNHNHKPLSYWRLDWRRRRCILETENDRATCHYSLDRPPRLALRGKTQWSLWDMLFKGSGDRERDS